jgi:hypothetical protein
MVGLLPYREHDELVDPDDVHLEEPIGEFANADPGTLDGWSEIVHPPEHVDDHEERELHRLHVAARVEIESKY